MCKRAAHRGHALGPGRADVLNEVRLAEHPQVVERKNTRLGHPSSVSSSTSDGIPRMVVERDDDLREPQ